MTLDFWKPPASAALFGWSSKQVDTHLAFLAPGSLLCIRPATPAFRPCHKNSTAGQTRRKTRQRLDQHSTRPAQGCGALLEVGSQLASRSAQGKPAAPARKRSCAANRKCKRTSSTSDTGSRGGCMNVRRVCVKTFVLGLSSTPCALPVPPPNLTLSSLVCCLWHKRHNLTTNAHLSPSTLDRPSLFFLFLHPACVTSHLF